MTVTTPNIVDIAVGSPDFEVLVKALAAANLVETVRHATDVTVFAPTDAAFATLAQSLGFAGDAQDAQAVFDFIAGALAGLAEDGDPIPLLTDILLYHVSPGAKSADEIDALDAVPTLLDGATFGAENNVLIDAEPGLENPTIVSRDVPAANGVIQVIDQVLIPIDVPGIDGNIVDIAAESPDFDILTAALAATGLDAAVRAADDVTVFAPTDAAFGQTAVDLGFEGDPADEAAVTEFLLGALGFVSDAEPGLLDDVLLYHVSPGAKTAAEIDGAIVGTLLGGATFAGDGTALIDNEPDIADPNIAIADVQAANGTIQAIDRVLLPIDAPGNTSLADLVARSGGAFDADAGDFDILGIALETAGLTDALDDPDAALTVFAPTDAAFIGLAVALGFEGSDEKGAFGFIVEALTLLGKGDPIAPLTDILLYHVAPGELKSGDVLAATEITTLLNGAALGVDPAALSLVDAEPAIADPMLVALDIEASNGIAHAIDGVLLPLALPSGASDFVIDGDGALHRGFGDGDDFVSAGGGDDRFWLGKGNDVGFGGAGDDQISGARGDDHVFGGDGDDQLSGNRGNDTLEGGDGDDWLFGGLGRDVMIGGGGADTFVLRAHGGRELVTDFEVGVDRIDVSRLHVECFGALEHRLTQVGEDAVLHLRGTTAVIAGVDVHALDAHDFIFA